MERYNFKKITVIPEFKDLKDIVLSKTQRKTPTEIHRHYAICRIRGFYMRKIKFLQQTLHDKLTLIITDFPQLESLHPFYHDLMTVLYDKDHYKLSLGSVNKGRRLIDNIGTTHVKLMKYGDSMYRCKQLKIAAFGRMMKVLKRLTQSLKYLEEVRQHMSRLPSIDPNTRTILLCGFPNVGKSSFINKITRAEVEVQPYAFTTKSLYVGHTDFQFNRYQVIDTPGILDHPIEEMNTIEMQAVTALSNIRAIIVYVLDPSELCGYSLEQQVNLFRSISPMFRGKPRLIVCSKCDLTRLEDLDEEKQALIRGISDEDVVDSNATPVFHMSAVTEEGVMLVKNEACQRLLDFRVQNKLNTKRVQEIANRLFVAFPKRRDDIDRKAFLSPYPVVEPCQRKRIKLEKEVEAEGGDDYVLDLRKHWDLPTPGDTYTIFPELINGMNVADFVDPDIDRKLERLLEEEARREGAGLYDVSDEDEGEKELEEQLRKIQHGRKLNVLAARLKRSNNWPVLPRSASESRGRKRKRDESRDPADTPGLRRSTSRARSTSRSLPRDQSGLRDEQMVSKVKKIAKNAQKKRNRQAKKGEGDRVIVNMKPKHLYVGKRGIGKTTRR